MEIKDLNKSISEMTDEELYDHLYETRTNRRAKPTPKPKPKTKTKKSPLPKNLTEEQRQELIKELENEM